MLWLASLGGALAIVGALALWPLRGIALLQRRTPDPGGVLAMLYNLGFWAAMAALFGAVAALVVRFRRSRGAERQQIKWLVYAVLVVVVSFPLPALLENMIGSELAAEVVYALLFAPTPVAVGVAILRYRLYDIDRLINRTLVCGLLTALLGAVYASLVLVLGQVFGGVGRDPPSWDESDLDTLAAELLAVVDQTMQPVEVDRGEDRVDRSWYVTRVLDVTDVVNPMYVGWLLTRTPSEYLAYGRRSAQSCRRPLVADNRIPIARGALPGT